MLKVVCVSSLLHEFAFDFHDRSTQIAKTLCTLINNTVNVSDLGAFFTYIEIVFKLRFLQTD